MAGSRPTFLVSGARCPGPLQEAHSTTNVTFTKLSTDIDMAASRSQFSPRAGDFRLHQRRNGLLLSHLASSSTAANANTRGFRTTHHRHRALGRSEANGVAHRDVHTRAPAELPDSDGGLQVGLSGLQRIALLQLLGPSITGSYMTGPSLLAGLAAGLAMGAPFGSGHAPHPQHRGDLALRASAAVSERSVAHVEAPPSAAKMPSIPAMQLHAACLASVAAALVRLPQASNGHGVGGQDLWSVLLQRLCGDRIGATSQHLQQQQQSQQRLVAAEEALVSGTGGRRAQAEPQEGTPSQQQAFVLGGSHASSVHVGSCCSARNGSAAAVGLRDSGVAAAAAAAAATSAKTLPGEGSVAAAGTYVSGGCQASGGATGKTQAAGGLGAATGLPSEASQVETAAEEEKRTVAGRPQMLENPIRYAKLLFAGAMSAVVSRTCVAPLERVKMDLVLRNGNRDALSTALQVLRTEGISGFWKGNALNVLRTAPFKAVNFFSFDMYHTALLALSGLDGNFERFAAGACAGVTATLVCFPLDVVRTRLLASVAGPRYGTGPFSTLAGILRNEGAAALYSGCLPAVIGMAPAGAVFYGVYDMLKHRHLESLAAEALEAGAADGAGAGAAMQPQPPPTLAPVYTLLYGAMAGAASELIVYPLEVIRRKMQLQSMALAGMRQVGAAHHMGTSAAASAAAAAAAAASGGAAALGGAAGAGAVAGAAGAAAGGSLAAAAASHHLAPHLLGNQPLPHKALMMLSAVAVSNSPGLSRVAAAVTAIIRADGPRGFYSGLLPNMLQVLPSAALSYYTYDTLKTVLGAR